MDIVERLVEFTAAGDDMIVKAWLPQRSAAMAQILDPPGCGHFYPHHEIGDGCRGSREDYGVPMVRHEGMATQRDIELASRDVKDLCQDLEFRFTERGRAPPQAARDKEKA